jgi:hypothetical protein
MVAGGGAAWGPRMAPVPGGRTRRQGITDIRQDLAAFDTRYHLPRADLSLGRALGFTGDTSVADSEKVQDTEMVYAIAPTAKIALMLVPLRAFADPPGLARRSSGPPPGAGTSSRSASPSARAGTASALSSCACSTARCAMRVTNT